MSLTLKHKATKKTRHLHVQFCDFLSDHTIKVFAKNKNKKQALVNNWKFGCFWNDIYRNVYSYYW